MMESNMAKFVSLMLIYCYVADTQKMGPFDLAVRTIENCKPHVGDKIDFKVRINKYNRTTYAVNANISFNIDLDDSLVGIVDMALFTNGGWKENFYKYRFLKGCSTVRQFAGATLKSVFKNAGIKDQCPIPKGNYTVNNWPLILDVSMIPSFFYGKYRFTLNAHKNDHRIGCVIATVDIVPRKKPSRN